MEMQLLSGRSFHRISKIALFCCLFWAGLVSAQQENSDISGTVVDAATQDPLPGASVVVKGTTQGTQTDFDGNFTLADVPPEAVLEISYLGYKTREVKVAGNSALAIQLAEDANKLDEVVIVGYGKQKKSDLTGAVGSVDSESLTERSLTSPLEALQGNVPGVQISTATGRLGDGFNITIRGKNSLSDDAQPLYVVDGVPTDGIDFLNPQDIERIDILKDASSTAIYGSRGSNGVVIVTTKSGATAKSGVTVTFDSYVGIKNVARLPKLMDPQKWWYYHQSAYLATASVDPGLGYVTEASLQAAVAGGSGNPLLYERVASNEWYDWYDYVLQSGLQQNNYISVSGRSESGLGYNVGVGVQKETGNIENESLDKYTFKGGINHRISDKVSMGTNLTIAMTEQELGSDVAMQEAFRLNPFLSPYGTDGELFPQPGKLTDGSGSFLIDKTSTYNPLLEIANTSDNIRRWNALGSLYFEYSPLDWLSFRTTYSAGFDVFRRGRSWGAQTNTGISNNNLPSSQMERSENFNYTWDNQFNIDYAFNEDHTIKALLLQSIFSSRTERSALSSRNQPFDTGYYNVGSGAQGTFNVSSGFVKQTLSSYALRLNYAFKGRYLLTLSNRWDGSSLLSEANRWDSFPSGALAWRISEEPFMGGQGTFSDLKLRASYGYTGNNIIAPYSTLNTLDRQTYYDFNGATANGWLPSAIANTQLAWEKTREVNVGLDFGLLKNRISGSIDVYDRLSDELLLEQQLPRESGWSSISANVGSVNNRGVEAALTTRNVETDLISWTTTFTFTKNTNEIRSLYGQTEADDVGNGWFIGESIEAQYNYRFLGIWQADEAAEAASYGLQEGQEKLLDVNGDGEYDPDNDRIILGSADPDWSGSFFTKLRVGNFDLSASVITNQGVYVYSPFHANFTDTRDRGRQKLDITWYIPENNAGIQPQVSNRYPQPRNEGTYWRNEGVGYYRDASFVKVKNISLGYNLAGSVSERLGLKQCRLYANVLNPFVFTEYDGYDPEWAGAGLGIGRVASVIYQLGVSVHF